MTSFWRCEQDISPCGLTTDLCDRRVYTLRFEKAVIFHTVWGRVNAVDLTGRRISVSTSLESSSDGSRYASGNFRIHVKTLKIGERSRTRWNHLSWLGQVRSNGRSSDFDGRQLFVPRNVDCCSRVTNKPFSGSLWKIRSHRRVHRYAYSLLTVDFHIAESGLPKPVGYIVYVTRVTGIISIQ